MQLNYKVMGEGSPLIILHGLFGSLDNWMTHAKNWSSQFKVYLVDQRNHGQSPQSDDFSYPLMAEDLRQFIEDHQLEKPSILGHSMGGKTAMEFAVRYSDQLDRLTVVDIAPVAYEVHHYAIIDALESIDLNSISSRSEADEQLKTKIEEVGIRQFLLKNLYWKEKDKLDWRFHLDTIKREIIPISEWSISKGKFNGKCLFIKGEYSNYIMPQYAGKIAEKFPHYQLEEIPDAGHWVHAEASAAFSKAFLTFMKD